MDSHIEIAAAGSRLYVRVLGERPPSLVFLHHQSGTSDLVPQQVSALAAYGVALPDARGRGRSACADASFYSWPQYAGDVVAILDALDVDTAVVGGVSFGAGVALATALAHDDRVSGLVLWASPYAGAERGWSPGQRRSLERTFALAKSVQESGGIDGIRARGAVDPSVAVERQTNRWLRHDPKSFAEALLAVGFDQPFESLDDLRAISVPTVVIPADNDMHPRHIGVAYADAIPGAILAEEATAEQAIAELLTQTAK